MISPAAGPLPSVSLSYFNRHTNESFSDPAGLVFNLNTQTNIKSNIWRIWADTLTETFQIQQDLVFGFRPRINQPAEPRRRRIKPPPIPAPTPTVVAFHPRTWTLGVALTVLSP
jgi:hypothetical protein